MSNPAPITVAQVLAKAISACPDIGNPSVSASNTYALSLFEETHAELLAMSDLLPDSTFIFSLTAGTKVYPLPAYAGKVWELMLFLSAGDIGRRIVQRDKDWFDAQRPGWRSQEFMGTPGECCLDGTNIIMVPTPNIGTGAGYPQVEVWSLDGQTLLATDTLPAQVMVADAWVYGMLLRHAYNRRKDLIPVYEKKFEIAKQGMIRNENKRMERDKPKVAPWKPRIQRG